MIIRRSHRLLVLALLTVAAYSLWWWLTARALQGRIDRWMAEERTNGAFIAPDRLSVGGYPLSFSIRADGVSLRWPKGYGMATQHLSVAAHPWSPFRFNVAATHGFKVELPPGSERPAYGVAGETLRGEVAFGGTSLPDDLKLTADGVGAIEGSAGANGDEARPETTIAILEVSASRPRKPPVTDTDVGLDFEIRAIDISAPSLESHPLGSTIADALLEGKIMGPLPTAPDPTGLKSWRDAGGNIEVSDLELRWGPLTMAGKGTLALDNTMQPEGAFTAHLVGWSKTIDTLAAAGWIRPGPASLAKLALGVASHADANGQSSVDTPVTIQSSRISVGPLKVGTIPELKLD